MDLIIFYLGWYIITRSLFIVIVTYTEQSRSFDMDDYIKIFTPLFVELLISMMIFIAILYLLYSRMFAMIEAISSRYW